MVAAGEVESDGDAISLIVSSSCHDVTMMALLYALNSHLLVRTAGGGMLRHRAWFRFAKWWLSLQLRDMGNESQGHRDI